MVLMAVFCAINLMGVKRLMHANSAATWWIIGVPMLVILVLAFTRFRAANFTAISTPFAPFAPLAPLAPFGAKGVLMAVPGSGIIFALLGFEQAIQIGGESRNPGRCIPRADVGSMVLGAVLYVACSWSRSARCPPGRSTTGSTSVTPTSLARSRAWPPSSAWVGWLRSSTSTRSCPRRAPA
jgi:amino acid transporter